VSYNYSSIQGTATRMIQKFGTEFTFTSKTQKVFEPDTGTQTSSIRIYKKYACKFDMTQADKFGEAVESGDIRLMAEAYDYKTGDTVKIGLDDYRVIAVSKIQPGDTNCAVNLQVRR